ncbi:hypothetical protein EB118_19320, partial [bacterium]|nr:hypothetical protein [bacterium]
GQINVFMSTLKGMKSTGLDAVTVYNSDGIKVALRLKRLKTLFVNKLEDQSIRYEEHSEYIQIKKNEMAICEFYGLLQDTGCKVVLTIGKDLISRGISFVSNKTENPLTATTMIYKPGSQLSQVALCQAIGRLNGTAQPGLTRRLYTTDDVYTNYITFCKNQKEIISAIKNNGNKVDDSLISDIALWKASRPVDRPSLKLERDMTFWSDAETVVSEDDTEDTDTEREIDGVSLTKLDKWLNGDSLVGKMIRYLYDQDQEISFHEFKYGVGYEGKDSSFADNIDNGRSTKSRQGKLWVSKNGNITLNNNIRSHIDKI